MAYLDIIELVHQFIRGYGARFSTICRGINHFPPDSTFRSRFQRFIHAIKIIKQYLINTCKCHISGGSGGGGGGRGEREDPLFYNFVAKNVFDQYLYTT